MATVKQLKQQCKEQGYIRYSKLRKAELEQYLATGIHPADTALEAEVDELIEALEPMIQAAEAERKAAAATPPASPDRRPATGATCPIDARPQPEIVHPFELIKFIFKAFFGYFWLAFILSKKIYKFARKLPIPAIPPARIDFQKLRTIASIPNYYRTVLIPIRM